MPTKANLRDLPFEILKIIVEPLHAPQLLALHGTCRRLCILLAQRKARDLQRCRERLEQERRQPVNHIFWTTLLIAILRHEFPPQLIQEISFRGLIMENDHPDDWYDERLIYIKQHESLIKKAMQQSPWIDNDEIGEIWHEIRFCRIDALMPLLLPLTVNLRHLKLQPRAPRTAELLRRAAWTQLDKSTESPLLPKLVLLSTGSGVLREMGEQFEHQWITKMVGLPSLRCVLLDCMNDKSFTGWPDDVVRPVCPEVLVYRSSLTIDLMQEFGSGWAGPCEMRRIDAIRRGADQTPPWKWLRVVHRASDNGSAPGELTVQTDQGPAWDGRETDQDREDMHARGINSYGSPWDPDSLVGYHLHNWRRLVGETRRRGRHIGAGQRGDF